MLASLLVELGEYDISGPTEFMSTKEKAVREYISLLTHHFSNGGRSKHTNSIYLSMIPAPQFYIYNNDATQKIPKY